MIRSTGRHSKGKRSKERTTEREKESKNQLKARDMKREYYYTSKNTGKREKVCCTRSEFLYIKLCYDINGLTPDEYEEYKAATR